MRELLLGLCLSLVTFSLSYGEDISREFKRVTEDYEVGDVKDVTVKQTTISSSDVTWTLSEIDYYIETNENKIDQHNKYIEDLKKIRARVEVEAKKVKLDGDVEKL